MADGTAYDQAVDQLSAYGLDIDDGLDTSGTLRRVRHTEDKPGKKDGWYVAHTFVTDAGREMVAGVYGWWKDAASPYRIKTNTRGLSEEERQRLRRQRAEMDRLAKEARADKAREAARRANQIWADLPEQGASEYLDRKKVRAYGLRFTRGTVVVPLRTITARMVGLQFIAGDGTKRFITGTAKQGAFHLIGEPQTGKRLCVAEGYATAATVHQATGLACAVAFDAGNMAPVCATLHDAYPHCPILVCGDDDHATLGNPGRSKAQKAATSVGGQAVFPRFDDADGTDWNDLHIISGLDAVREQLREAFRVEKENPPSPPEGSGASFPFDLGILLREYVLVYGTETVYDGRIGRIVSLSGLRAAATKGLVRQWQEHPGRRLVHQEGVVFDPACTDDDKTTVNLFRGWPIVPRDGDCSKLKELLDYLCSESHEIIDWVLKWAAYPLQNPGAKMRTAIVMHGPEGTGKNTFWGAVREIYAEYGAIISQTELESQFNGWASRKLFVIGNEVVSRQEMYHQKGRLKNMITEPEWAINEKMMPLRMEANHANFVFFSNVVQPATPDPDDRRMMVIWTPPAREESIYKAVAHEIANGGVEALYYYLLNYDLEDFGPHTKPLMTQAKEELIDASMDNHERFYRQWRADELPIKFRPCASLDLYRAYRRWCDERGERAPAREAVFSAAMAKRITRRKIQYKDLSSKSVKPEYKQGMVFHESDWKPSEGVKVSQSIGDSIQTFRCEMETWRGESNT